MAQITICVRGGGGGGGTTALVQAADQICTHVSANNFWTARSKSKIQ